MGGRGEGVENRFKRWHMASATLGIICLSNLSFFLEKKQFRFRSVQNINRLFLQRQAIHGEQVHLTRYITHRIVQWEQAMHDGKTKKIYSRCVFCPHIPLTQATVTSFRQYLRAQQVLWSFLAFSVVPAFWLFRLSGHWIRLSGQWKQNKQKRGCAPGSSPRIAYR